MEFRLAKKADAQRLLEIYRPYVEKTAITFEYEVPTLEEFENRIEKIGSQFPYLLAIENGKIIGYAYAGAYRERAAYDWVVELSIYLDEKERQHGAGSVLYQKLLTALAALNYQRAYACITYPNLLVSLSMRNLDFNKLDFSPRLVISLNNGMELFG